MLRKWFQIWWRGWADEDLVSVREKTAATIKPGGITYMSKREYRAFIANDPTLQ